VPSVAHRLALVAAGEAAAAISLNGPGAWDYGAGHALLRAVGATLVDEHGREVGYGPDGHSRCRWAFGGREAAVRVLAGRAWRNAEFWGDRPPEGFPTRLRRGESVRDAGLLSRAQGCLLGQVAGDSLGGLVEFENATSIPYTFGGCIPKAVHSSRAGP
jgi:hypothetical protein